MRRAALFVASFLVHVACANDFDALSSGTPEMPASDPRSSSGGGSGTNVFESACTTADCTLECPTGSSCTLDCAKSDFCDVSCGAKSTCVVENCGDSCDVTCSDGSKPLSCGDRILACGGCP